MPLYFTFKNISPDPLRAIVVFIVHLLFTHTLKVLNEAWAYHEFTDAHLGVILDWLDARLQALDRSAAVAAHAEALIGVR